MKKSGIVEKYVQLVQDMYEESKTVVRCAIGTTESFKVKVGLHQGSALIPFLFAVIMDMLTDEVRREPLWTMLFADDIVICEETREEVERRLRSWSYAFERRGMKICRSMTEYLCINGGNDDETVKMENTKVPRVKEFKYLGSTVQESGNCEREVKKRVQEEWNGRRVSGVICDRRLPARVKGKVYSSVVKPAMVYGLETVTVTKKQVKEMEVAEIKMLRFAMGVMRKDKIRNEYIRSTVKIERLRMKMREGRKRWYGHVMRRDQEYVGRKMMEIELQGKMRRGRPKRRFLDVVKEDMGEVGAKETDVEDRKMWRMMIRCGHSRLKGKAERRKRRFKHISNAMERVKYPTIREVLLWKKNFWIITSVDHLTSQHSKLLKEKLLVLYQTNGMIPIYIKLSCFFF